MKPRDALTPAADRWSALAEAGIFLVESLPGLSRPPFAGLRFRSFPGRHPLAHIVGDARLAAADAAATVARVRDHFAACGEPFSWRVGPASEPADLASQLVAGGLRPAFTMRGMAMPGIVVPDAADVPIVVRDAAAGDLPALAALVAAAYPVTGDVASRLATLYLQPAAFGLVRVVVAAAPGHDGLVGMGVSYDFPDCPVAVLAGAATLPSFRGRGVYCQLLARRLRDARERGMTGAVTQAVSETSAPILRRAGFIDVSEIRAFEWHPTDLASGDGR